MKNFIISFAVFLSLFQFSGLTTAQTREEVLREFNKYNYELPNEAGGKIVLTPLQCIEGPAGSPKIRKAYSYTATGIMADACWGFVDNRVLVIWESGIKRIFETDNFKQVRR